MGNHPLTIWLRRHAVFLFILSIGLVLRSLFMTHQGLSNDELSAWYRTSYSDWNSFWFFGVKSGDMHPAFYQVLLWVWVRLFGDSEFALRSTGLIFYLLNSLLLYRIGCKFYSKFGALLIVGLYACLTFTVIHTVFARPYNSGTFFLLLSFWSVLELKRDKEYGEFSWWYIWLLVGFIGSMLSHYFAFLTAGIVGLSAFFYLPKERFKALVICGFSAVVLFLPHLTITLHHLGTGGLDWLGAPKLNWLPVHLVEYFNQSELVLGLFVGLLIWIWYSKRNDSLTGEEQYAFTLGISVYVVAHLISVFFTPILRELVLLFFLPFLIFGLIGNVSFKLRLKESLLLGGVFIVLAFHSLKVNRLLEPVNFGVFKEVGLDLNSLDEIYGRENLEVETNYNNDAYINYYLNNPVKSRIKDWTSPEAVYQLAEIAQQSKKNHFVYALGNKFHIPMYLEVIRDEFPTLKMMNKYAACGIWMFQKNGRGFLENNLVNESKIKGVYKDEFFGNTSYSVEYLEKNKKGNDYFVLESKGILNNDSPLYWVATVDRDNQMLMEGENPKMYLAYDQNRLYGSGDTVTFKLAFDLPADLKPNDQIKCYFWNPDKTEVYVENTVLKRIAGSL